MGLPYRAHFRLADDDDAVRVASEQFRAWLREKAERAGWTVWDWDEPGVYRLGENALLQVVRHEGDDGGCRQLLELRELSKSGTWTTQLYASSLPSAKRLKQALWLSTTSGDGITPKPPRLARRILEATDVWNGDVPVLAIPATVDVDDVDTLVQHILDPHRDLSLVVAAPLGIDTEVWRVAVGGLLRDSIGAATAYLPTGEAFDALNAALSTQHQIPPGSVRTFMPRVDLEDPSDARRHRILTARTMAREYRGNRFSPWLTERHSRAAREHLAQTSMPSELARVESILEKLRLQELRSVPAGTVAPADVTPADVTHAKPALETESTDPELSEDARGEDAAVVAESMADGASSAVDFQRSSLGRRLHALVTKFTSSDRLDDASIGALETKLADAASERERSSAQIDALIDQRDELSRDRDRLRKQLEDEQLEREIAEGDRRAIEKRYRALLHWKNATGLHEYVDVETEESWKQPPMTVRDLVARFDDEDGYEEVTRYVEITDIVKAYGRADDIDERDTIGRYGETFWEYVLVLRDYAIAYQNGFSGGVHDYLTNDTVDGQKCTPVRHKPTESESVASRARWRDARTFPVPVDVDPSGLVYMDAHFAPTHRDTFAPRMHYCSDVAHTGKIYIGYIGKHLENTKTN